MEELKVISLSHKEVPLDLIGRFHMDSDRIESVLQHIRHRYLIDEIFYLSTCNRIELVFTFKSYLCSGLSESLFKELFQGAAEEFPSDIKNHLHIHHGMDAMRHLMRVSSSLEAMLVGEQEIITQMRKAFEQCTHAGLTGDVLRLAMKKTIQTAKRCFTETGIASNPVSVAFLAWQKLRESGLKKQDEIILVGAGQMIRSMARFMKKWGMDNVTIANRTPENAASISNEWKVIDLDTLRNSEHKAKAYVFCTGAEEAIVDAAAFERMNGGQPFEGKVVDLSLPPDVDAAIPVLHPCTYISMQSVKAEADANLALRLEEVDHCEHIIEKGLEEYETAWQHRQVELAMREIPQKIKEIRNTALGDIFAKDLGELDENSRELLVRILDYMEKKYISVPMKMAREVIIDKVQKN